MKYDYFPQKQNFNVLMVESFLIVQVLALFVTDLNPKLVLILELFLLKINLRRFDQTRHMHKHVTCRIAIECNIFL